MIAFWLLGLAALGGAGWYFGQRQVLLRREAFIRQAELPRGLFDALRKHRPELSLKDCQLVANGLRQFFLAHLKSGRRYVSMPSRVVDDLWHEFILHTKNYDAFCAKAFGRFLHHTPAAAMTPHEPGVNAGLRRCWWYACVEEHLHPRQATRLPLLFALDTKLGIAGGFAYTLDALAEPRRPSASGNSTVFVVGDFGSREFDGSLEGLGPDDGGSDGGSGGGDGGSGDGGGCGGGGCGGGGGD